MIRSIASALVLVLGVLASAGCGGSDPSPAPTVDERRLTSFGLDLFEERVIGSNPGCVTCHSLDEGVTLVGPSLFGIGTIASSRSAGMTAAQYLRESIVAPDEYVGDGFSTGLMPGDWAEYLTEEQIDSLVEALLEL